MARLGGELSLSDEYDQGLFEQLNVFFTNISISMLYSCDLVGGKVIKIV